MLPRGRRLSTPPKRRKNRNPEQIVAKLRAGRWPPTWTFDRTTEVTVAWYRDLRDAASPSAVAAKTPQDIRRHEADARGRGVGWAVIPPLLAAGIRACLTVGLRPRSVTRSFGW
jgi:hypothetical protein